MDVQLPSQQPDKNMQLPHDIVRKQHILSSMHIVYGGAIVVLALVVSGLVCVLGNVQIPYVSALFTPAVPPPFVPDDSQRNVAHPVVPVVATSSMQVASSTNVNANVTTTGTPATTTPQKK